VRRSHVIALFFSLGLSAQESPSIFELRLPDFSETAFTGANPIIEIPDRPIRRLQILVRDAQRRNMNPGKYKIFVNGKGFGNVIEERTVPEGSLLVMEPEALRKRPDELFDSSENAIEMIAFNRAGRQFYQNWIIRTNASQRNALFAYSSVISPNDPAGIPPDLIVTEPAQPPSLDAGKPSIVIPLRGRVSRNATLTVNGQPVLIQTTAASNDFHTSVTVPRGKREIVIEALDAKGNSRKTIIPIFSIDPSVRPIRFAGQKYAVVVGISQFGTSTGAPPPITLAAAEAQEFATNLQKFAGFKQENIRLLTDEKASLEQIRVALTDFASKAQTNDLLVLYFATHGLHDPRPGRSDRIYFAVHGTQMAQLDSTALGLSDLELYLNRGIRTNQSVLIFDVGHRLNKDWTFSGQRNLVNAHVLRLFGNTPGRHLLVSGSSDQIAEDQTLEGRPAGLFQYWLGKALAGAADLNSDKVVTPRELFSFVAEKVKTASDGAQAPRFVLSEKHSDLPIQ